MSRNKTLKAIKEKIDNSSDGYIYFDEFMEIALYSPFGYFNSGEIRHAVNVVSVDPQTLEKMRGHLDVAYRLGLALAQLHRGSPSRCCLNYRGDVAEKNTRLLSAAFCAGLLERCLLYTSPSPRD